MEQSKIIDTMETYQFAKFCMRKELKSERANQAFKQREKDKQRAYEQEP